MLPKFGGEFQVTSKPLESLEENFRARALGSRFTKESVRVRDAYAREILEDSSAGVHVRQFIRTVRCDTGEEHVQGDISRKQETGASIQGHVGPGRC